MDKIAAVCSNCLGGYADASDIGSPCFCGGTLVKPAIPLNTIDHCRITARASMIAASQNLSSIGTLH